MNKRERDAWDIGFTNFWDSTLRELSLAERAYEKNYKQELQVRVRLMYDECMLTGQVMGRILSGKGTVPTIDKMYPGLFDEKDKEPLTPETDVEFQRTVAGFKAFVQVYNLQHKENGGSE